MKQFMKTEKLAIEVKHVFVFHACFESFLHFSAF